MREIPYKEESFMKSEYTRCPYYDTKVLGVTECILCKFNIGFRVNHVLCGKDERYDEYEITQAEMLKNYPLLIIEKYDSSMYMTDIATFEMFKKIKILKNARDKIR
jgi:hypothetical protein